MAIGARRADVLRLVLRQGIVTASVGLAIGFALGAATTRLTVTLLYGVSSSDPISYGAAFVALAAVSLIAALLPAREIARVDPVVALRQTWLAFVANSHLSINASRGDRPVAPTTKNCFSGSAPVLGQGEQLDCRACCWLSGTGRRCRENRIP